MTPVMWRNVFGHAIWQIILLSVILLGGQGIICHNYIAQCFEFDKEVCVKYNPFYTNQLYLLDNEINNWKTLNLKAAKFDKTALDFMVCENFIKKNKKHHSYECTKADLSDVKNAFLPQD